jgi:hypothetical protein
VYLIFLIRKSYKATKREIEIPKAFAAQRTSTYQKPQKYNELEYQIYTTELRMEFYLRVMEMFRKPGDTMFSIFGGGKVVCTGMVSYCNFFALFSVFGN